MKTSITFLFSILLFFSLKAQVFVSETAMGDDDGSSWEHAFTNLESAINNAPFGSEIWIAAGTYKPSLSTTPLNSFFSLGKKLELYGGFAGTETTLDQRDWTVNETILSGDINGDDVANDFENFRSDNAGHVILIEGAGTGSILDGLSIQSGNTRTDDIPTGTNDFSPWRGGGVLSTVNFEIRNCKISQCNGLFGVGLSYTGTGSSNSAVIVESCTFENNNSRQGAAAFRGAANLSILNCTIQNNNAETIGGGFVIGNTNALVEDCIFENNESATSLGGGIIIFQNSGNNIQNPNIEIRRSEFLSNKAFFGGAICFNNFFPNSSITIDSCNFFQNEATSTPNLGGVGGGILIQNLEDTFGGGLSSMSVTISNSTIEENEGIFGGGAYVFSNFDTLDLNIENTEFIENSSEDFGGGIVIGNSLATLDGCNFERNSSENSIGGGVLFFHNGENDIPAPSSEVLNTDFLENFSGAGGGGLTYNNFFPNSSITIDGCDFSNNETNDFNGAGGGLLLQNLLSNDPTSSLSIELTNSILNQNDGSQGGGAFIFSSNNTTDLLISNTDFTSNNASTGGGLILASSSSLLNATISESNFNNNNANIDAGGLLVGNVSHMNIQKSIFSDNSCKAGATGIQIEDGSKVFLETVLFEGQSGNAAIINEDSLWMLNVTLADNGIGLSQNDGGYTNLQNTIFSNNISNYIESGTVTVETNGGNVSSDSTLNNYLTGFGGFNDFNNTDPLLSMDFVPEENSVCLDAGNSNGITLLMDLANNDRIQGVEVDAGAFESPFTTPLRELVEIDFKVFPNPFVDEITISNLEGIIEITLLDILGKEINQFPVENTLYINKALPTGVYFLKVKMEERYFLKKIEKQ